MCGGSLFHLRVLGLSGALPLPAFRVNDASRLQTIVFLGIHAKVNPLLVFFLINATDLFCLFISGPPAAFLRKKNRRLMKSHQRAESDAADEFGLESLIKWAKVRRLRL